MTLLVGIRLMSMLIFKKCLSQKDIFCFHFSINFVDYKAGIK